MKWVLTCEVPNLTLSQNPCQMFLLIYVFRLLPTCQVFSPKSSIQVMITTGPPSYLAVNFFHFLPPSLLPNGNIESILNQYWINIQIQHPPQNISDFNVFLLIATLIIQVVFFPFEPALWDIGGSSCVPVSGLFLLDSSSSLPKSHLPKPLLNIVQRFPPAHLLRSGLVSLTFHNPPPVAFLPPYSPSAFVDFSQSPIFLLCHGVHIAPAHLCQIVLFSTFLQGCMYSVFCNNWLL